MIEFSLTKKTEKKWNLNNMLLHVVQLYVLVFNDNDVVCATICSVCLFLMILV